jgi:hypothetical protein
MDIPGPTSEPNIENLDMALIVSPPGTDSRHRLLRRQAKAGVIRSLGHGLYTDDLSSPLERVSQRELLSIISALVPKGLISHRSALDSGISYNGFVHLTGPVKRNFNLPGLTLKIIKGPGPLPADTKIPTALPGGAAYRSAIPRALLENLQNRRAADSKARSILGQEGMEGWLEKFLSRHDETALNRLRDQARAISEELKWGEEFEKLDRLIGALLGTRKTSLKHPRAIARAQGLPFDAERVDLFQTVSTYLNDNPPVVAPTQANADPALQAFVESYFSNFIEGTEFELEEAHQIVMSATPLKYREDDSHDVIGTFNAIMASRNKPLADTREAFERQLLDWNAQVIFSRRSKNPGHWKERGNQAGNTVFVSPPLVLGTLAKGFELIAATPQPEARATLAKFIVSEIHPFTDGNGRVSRLLMNQILSAAGLTRIIIPTVFREDYTLSLKALSNNANAEPYARMLTRAAKFSSLLDYSSQARLFKQLAASNALKDHSTDKLRLKDLERVE